MPTSQRNAKLNHPTKSSDKSSSLHATSRKYDSSGRDFALLNRLTYGPKSSDIQEYSELGLPNWLDSQLHPEESADQQCLQKLKDCQIRIRYPEHKENFWPAMDEMRPLNYLEASPEILMSLNEPGTRRDYQELIRPRVDVCMGSLIRAVYSRWQLREIMVDFWHNHFNVNAWDQSIGQLFPVYDRDVIRRYALGNFRQMLEAVAKSGSMLIYLNNRSSRTGAPNENFARELFELHTMGEKAYLNSLYNRWRQVPGALSGHPRGYIDQDVYEAARAFTGWTLSDGSRVSADQVLARNGRFAYVPSWHDNYQKRVLATEFNSYQPEQFDGLRVLDLLSEHPSTARHLARKLCVRLISDEPSPSIVESAASIWLASRHQDDQIAKVIKHIVLSREFELSFAKKLKRPFNLAVGLFRELNVNFTPSEGLINELAAGGQRLFGWPGPNGHPETAYYWLSTNAMRRRWTLVQGIINNQFGNGSADLLSLFGSNKPLATSFVETWSKRLLGRTDKQFTDLVLGAANFKPEFPITKVEDAKKLLTFMVISPQYQHC